jgi:hypothetical protein
VKKRYIFEKSGSQEVNGATGRLLITEFLLKPLSATEGGGAGLRVLWVGCK